MVSLTRLNRGSLDKVNQTLLPLDKTNLVGYWPFWENAGTIAYDESKNGNDGTINGATWGYSTALSKPYLSFDNIDDYVDVTGIPATDAISVIVFANGVYHADIDQLFSFDSSVPGVYTRLNAGSVAGDVRFYCKGSTIGDFTVSGIATGELNMYALTALDGGNLVGYINRSNVGSDPVSGFVVISGYNDVLGCTRDISVDWMDGWISGVLLYFEQLSDAEIFAIYDKYLG